MNAILVFTCIISVVCLLGRENVFLGSALNIGRWVLAVLLFILLLKRRRPFFSGLRIAAMGCFLLILAEWLFVLFHVYRLPSSSAKETHRVSLLSYNVFFKNKNPQSIVDIIQKSNPDLVLLQELTLRIQEYLQSRLPQYAYREWEPKTGTHGSAILSRFPLADTRLFAPKNGGPYAHCANVMISAKKLRLCNAHLASPAIAVEKPEKFFQHYSENYRARSIEIRQLGKEWFDYADQESPMVLGGDLNTLSIEPLYDELRRNWFDMNEFGSRGISGTFPNSKKFYGGRLRLDYFLVRGGIIPVSQTPIKAGHSDHFPILAEIGI